MQRLVQVIYTFIIEADDLKETHGLIADSLKLDPVQGVVVAQRQIKASDPFVLDNGEIPIKQAKRA